MCVCERARVCASGPRCSRVCTQLIYNPQRKQNCKSHPQIFPIEVLVTGRHAVNSQEQAGLPPALAPSCSLLLKWAPLGGPAQPREWLPTLWPSPTHQKCWLLSHLRPAEAPKGTGGPSLRVPPQASSHTTVFTGQVVRSRAR